MNWFREWRFRRSRLHQYSDEWDKTLNELLDKHRFIVIVPGGANLGPLLVYTASHPFADICPIRPVEQNVTASLKTTLRARDALLCDALGIERKFKK